MKSVARGLTNNSFTDKSANQPKTFYYVVKAADRSLNTSVNSAQVSATPSCGPALVARLFVRRKFQRQFRQRQSTPPSPRLANICCRQVWLRPEPQWREPICDGCRRAFMAGVTNFTFAAWVYWNGGAAWQRIFDFGNDTTQYMFLTPSSRQRHVALRHHHKQQWRVSKSWKPRRCPPANGSTSPSRATATLAKLYTNGVPAASGTVTRLRRPVSIPVLNNLGMSQYPDPIVQWPVGRGVSFTIMR